MMNDNMGYVYICEDVSPEEPKLNILNITEKPNLFFVTFETSLQSFGVINRNHRMYEIDNVWNCITRDEKIQDLIRNKSWFGECDHPFPRVDGEKLSPERIMNPDMNNTSHKILNPYRSGNLINATIETDAGTLAGTNMAKKIIQGMTPRFSARALADLVNKNGTPTVNMKKLITYDWVLYPSHPEAHAISSPKVVAKEVDVESVIQESQDVTEATVIIPIFDILQEATAKSENAKVIMESFEIDAKQIYGLSDDKSHLLAKDGKNVIGIKLESKIRDDITKYLGHM